MARTGAVVNIVGGKELRSALRAAGGKPLLDEVRDARREVAEQVVAEALPHIPMRTGRLRRATRSLASQTSGRAVSGGGAVRYAGAIHWGRKTGNVWGNRKGRNVIGGRPYLWDAAQRVDQRGVAARAFEKRISALIDRLFRR